MGTTWTVHSAGHIVFGQNSINLLGEVARHVQAKRGLVITDPILEEAGLVDRVRGPRMEAGIEVETFNGGEPEPSLHAAEACAKLGHKVRPDAVIGLGGGSNMDLAKLAATLLAHGGSPRDFVGDDKIPGPIASLICVPTTAGTGSAVSAASVAPDTDNHT